MALEFGLDTFLPVTVDESGLPIAGDQVIRNAVEEAVLADAVGVDSFNIGEHYRTEFMDSAGACGPRRDRKPDGDNPARHRRHGSQHARPGAAVHRLRHARRRLERPRAADRRSRLADGVVPALRVRPRRLRGAVRGEARPARPPPPRAACDLVGQVPVGAHGPARQPTDSRGSHPDLGRGGRQPAVGRARRTLRPPADAGRHRRPA